MKKLIALLLILVLICALFVACSPDDGDDTNLPGGLGGNNDNLHDLPQGSDNVSDDQKWDLLS